VSGATSKTTCDSAHRPFTAVNQCRLLYNPCLLAYVWRSNRRIFSARPTLRNCYSTYIFMLRSNLCPLPERKAFGISPSFQSAGLWFKIRSSLWRGDFPLQVYVTWQVIRSKGNSHKTLKWSDYTMFHNWRMDDDTIFIGLNTTYYIYWELAWLSKGQGHQVNNQHNAIVNLIRDWN